MISISYNFHRLIIILEKKIKIFMFNLKKKFISNKKIAVVYYLPNKFLVAT
jgi:hypothetical protein